MADSHSSRLINLQGKTFGRWLVIERAPDGPKGETRWWCQCQCGKKASVQGHHLRRNLSQSCGCLKNELIGAQKRTHGLASTPEFRIWKDMRRRCSNHQRADYPRYGGRGITVCERWSSFENFMADMGPRPSSTHSIDRKDNDLGYSPDNCYWATDEEQRRNKRETHLLTYKNQTLCLVDWAKILAISRQTIRTRLKMGWSFEKIVETPPRSKSHKIKPSPLL